jgi:exodeoxyribonuclease V alpha subunit
MSRLTYSHRFGSDTAIGKLSQAINTAGQDDEAAAGVWEKVQAIPANDTFRRLPCGEGLRDGQGHPRKEFREAILQGFKPFLDENKLEDIFQKLDQFRILCAVRNGPFGVKTINWMVEEILSLKGVDRESLHANDRPAHVLEPSPRGYDHQVILITVNDYTLNLFNGDVGVVLNDERTGELMAHFAGLSPEGTFLCRSFALNLLPTYETAFAMTIHKSQGSEFGKVLLVLPPDPQSPLLTRELLYTGLTRTKGPVDLWCTEETFKIAVKTRIQRSSGLAERISNR